MEGAPEAEGAEGAEGGGGREWGVRVALAGLSVSLVARAPPAELVHARLAGLTLDLAAATGATRLALAVHHMQWDNQVGAP